MSCLSRLPSLVVFFALAVLSMMSCEGVSADEPVVVHIGFAAPLTGPSASDGKEMENAARLAIEDANSRRKLRSFRQ